MTTRAYSELYLNDAMCNLGDMLDFMVHDCGYNPDESFSWFISSGIASAFEIGSPKYVSGMSGFELASEVIFCTHGFRPKLDVKPKGFKTPEYWAGWILAYYQWYRNLTFEKICSNGLSVSNVLSMYVLHEADNSKFIEIADSILLRNIAEAPSPLKLIRLARGYTQKELANASGVSLRMIQLYEQRQNDINKAQVTVIVRLARALGCEVDDLLDEIILP